MFPQAGIVASPLARLWTGRCTITVLAPEERGNQTVLAESTLAADVPCRLSYETVTAADGSDDATTVLQAVKLFLSPELRIPAGAQIDVTQNGVTERYAMSGQAAVYSAHQEIPVTLWRRRA